MDVIGTAATLYRKEGMKAMLFHLTPDDHVRIINEQEPAETGAGGYVRPKHRRTNGDRGPRFV